MWSYARLSRPFYVEIFNSGHMIKCLLTEFGGAGRENICLSVMKNEKRYSFLKRERQALVFTL